MCVSAGGRKPGTGEDLAILSLCNHSIIGVGLKHQEEEEEEEEK